jgi:hypothetical protein
MARQTVASIRDVTSAITRRAFYPSSAGANPKSEAVA